MWGTLTYNREDYLNKQAEALKKAIKPKSIPNPINQENVLSGGLRGSIGNGKWQGPKRNPQEAIDYWKKINELERQRQRDLYFKRMARDHKVIGEGWGGP